MSVVYLAIILIIILFIHHNASTRQEGYADPYSIELQAKALNRMARWNLYHSRKTSSINNVIVPPLERMCFYSEY